jgi:hypothetical protein
VSPSIILSIILIVGREGSGNEANNSDRGYDHVDTPSGQLA